MKKKILFITNSIKKSFKNTFDYKGRSTRAEYWILSILSIIFSLTCLILFFQIEIYTMNKTGNSMIIDFDHELNKGISGEDLLKKYETKLDFYLNLVVYLSYAVFILPLLSLNVRRLHDLGRPGFLMILYLIIYIPLEIIDLKSWTADNTNLSYFLITINLIWFLYCSQKSDKRKNQYGPVPKNTRTRTRAF